jgi:hypothetical protein
MGKQLNNKEDTFSKTEKITFSGVQNNLTEDKKPTEILSGGELNSDIGPDSESYEKIAKEIKELRDDFRQEKANMLVIFGIFASIIAFLSVSIQVFQSIKTPLSISGIILFILGGLSLFLLLLLEISKNVRNDQSAYLKSNIFTSHIFIISLVCIIFGASFIILDSFWAIDNRKEFIHIKYEN